METVIVICLLIVIALLVQDKIVIMKRSEQKPKQEKVNLNLPDIMGQPKPVRSLSMPNTANESQLEEQEINPDNLDIEYDENENVGIQIPQEELEEVFKNTPDWEEEEEEWNSYGPTISDNGFATGVTFDELTTVGALLQHDKLEPALQQKAVDIVQRIQGTELFSLLEGSMEGASKKIAILLDKSLSAGSEPSSSIMRNNELNDFDIGEFV